MSFNQELPSVRGVGGAIADTDGFARSKTDSVTFPLASTLAAYIIAFNDNLAALSGLNSTVGLVEQTGAHTFTKRALGVGASTSIPTLANADARYLQLTGDTMTGALQVPAGLVGTPGIRIGDPDTGFFLQAAGKLSGALDGVETHRILSGLFGIGAGFDPTESLHIRRTGGASRIKNEAEGPATIQSVRYDTAGAPSFVGQRARGTIASPAAVASTDDIFSFSGQAYYGAGFAVPFEMKSTVVAGTPSVTDMEAVWSVLLAPAGSVTRTEGIKFGHAAGLSLYSTVVIDNNRLFRIRVYTVATLPTAGTKGRKAMVSDATAPTYLGALTGGGAVNCEVVDNGSAWVSC